MNPRFNIWQVGFFIVLWMATGAFFYDIPRGVARRNEKIEVAHQRELERITQAIRAHDAKGGAIQCFEIESVKDANRFVVGTPWTGVLIQSTTGDCSNIVSGSGNVSVNCGGESEKRSKP